MLELDLLQQQFYNSKKNIYENKYYLRETFITCLLHFPQKNIFESEYTALLQTQSVYHQSS